MWKAVLVVSLALAVSPVWSFSKKDLATLKAGNSCPGCDLSGARLKGAKLAKAKLSGANLRQADLRGADLSSAIFIHNRLIYFENL